MQWGKDERKEEEINLVDQKEMEESEEKGSGEKKSSEILSGVK